MIEDAGRDAAAVEHEVFADDAAGVGETVGKLFVGGEKKETRSFGTVGADDYGFRFLQMRVAMFVEIDGAGGAAVAIHFDAMDVGVRANFAATGFFGYGNGGGQRAGFCADFAAEGQAEAAVDAGAASSARLRQNGHGRGKRMPTKLASGTFKNYAGTFHGKRRHGIGLGARRIERAGAGEAGHADFPFHFGVVRLEVGVGDGPIAEVGAGNGTDFAALDEINFVETPEIGSEVHAGAADEASIDEGALRLGFFVGRFAERSGLELGLVGEEIFVDNFYFVVNEIGFGEIGTLLEHDDAKAVGGKLLGHDPAGGAGADDYEIDFVGSLIFRRVESHALVFSASGGS